MSDALPNRRGRRTRILSLCLPRLPTDRLRRTERTASGALPETRPLAVVEKIHGAQRVVAVDAIAAHRGIRVDVSLADARAAHPDLRVVEADPAADRRLLEAIADWCDRYTPLVALDPPDGLFLDISGCAHLFAGSDGHEDDGEATLLADCVHRLAAQGFAVAGAVASTAGAAWAVSRFGKGGIVPAGKELEAIAGLPVAALRLDFEQTALLERLGLKRIDQLVGKPRAPLAARFGIDLINRFDQALGYADEALSPRRPAPLLLVERRFVEPLVEEDALLAALESLARTLAPALDRQGVGARLLEAAFFRVDGAVTRLRLATASPLNDPPAIATLFRERLTSLRQEWDAGFGFEMARLAVAEAERLDETQTDLSGEGGKAVDLACLFDRLSARLGAQRITRFAAVDTHVPERAVRTEPLTAGEGMTNLAAGKGRGFETSSRGFLPETPPDRPLKLFARPEPVEVIAEVPEGPPLKFRWRRVLYEVARAEGPERIAPEWWRPDDAQSPTRDYFRVEDAQGRRYWLFRAGLYGRETLRPLWYVHGLFA
jgi:protein ImuB